MKPTLTLGIFISLFVLFLPLEGTGQKFPQYWVFDEHGGIIFSNDTTVKFVSTCDMFPQWDTNGGQSIYNENVCVFTRDSNSYIYGNSQDLFLSNGSLVENGSGQPYNPHAYSIFDGSVLLEQDTNLLFWVANESALDKWNNPDYPIGSYGLKYSVFEVSQDRLGGRVNPLQKDIYLAKDALFEFVIAIRHGNGRDWWVLSQKLSSSNVMTFQTSYDTIFFRGEFALGQWAGASDMIGEWDYDPGSGILGYLSYESKSIIFLHFDNCTGQFDFLRKYELGSSGPPWMLYGFAFSDNFQFGYFSGGTGLYQFDIDLQSPILNYRCIFLGDTISQSYSHQVLQLQKGPDKKVYFTRAAPGFFFGPPMKRGTIGRIENPDLPFPQCNVVWNYFQDSAWNVTQALPNLPVDVPWKGITAGTVTTSQDSGCYPLI